MSTDVKPGYKQTEVGVIPEDWKVTFLGRLSEFITSGSRGWARYYSDRGPLFVRSQNIRDGRLDFTDQQRVIAPTDSEASRTRLKHGDLLITVTGNSVGNVACVEQDLGEAYISQHVGLVRLLDPLFYKYVCLFLSPGSPGNWQIWESQTGQSKPGLNLKNLQDLCISLPPLTEQATIAGALSDADALIESLEQLVAKKRQIKQGAMQELLTGRRRLPGFTGEWEVRELSDVCIKIQDGTHFSPKLGGNDFLYVTSKNIGFGTLDLRQAERISATEHAKIYARCDVTHGDLLLTKDGANTGNAALNTLDEPFSLLSSVAMLRFDKRKQKASYYLYQMLSPDGQRQIKELMSGNAITRLTLLKIRSLRFPVASLAEQTAIAAILSDMDAEVASLETQLAKARQVKQGMMQELLTGRIRLV